MVELINQGVYLLEGNQITTQANGLPSPDEAREQTITYGILRAHDVDGGKGKSMPSRHTASAAAIALAAAYAFSSPAVTAFMALLCLLIASLRVLCGQHYISDVLAALALSLAVSLIGYGL